MKRISMYASGARYSVYDQYMHTCTGRERKREREEGMKIELRDFERLGRR